MKKLLCILCSLLIVLFAATSFAAAGEKRVVLGIERIDEPFAKQLLAGKRLGLFTNQSGVDSKLRSSTELLQKSYNLTALFVPEHGLFGAVAAGETFESHTYKDIPVHSLYGEDRSLRQKCWMRLTLWWLIFRMSAFVTIHIFLRLLI